MKRTAQPGDGSVYRKGNLLGIVYYTAERDPSDPTKWKREWISTGLPIGQEKKARAALEQIRQQVLEEVRTGKRVGPMTLGRFAEEWFAERERDEVATVRDERGRFKHAAALHGLPLSELTPRHFQDLIKELGDRIGREKKDMAPRTVRHVYSVLRQMLGAAFARGLVPANPCEVEKKDLPKKRDKNPLWRKTAVYRRDEVELLISDARVPEERRTLYGLLFLGGLRVGEAAALTWADYDAEREPLGELQVALSFSRKRRALKSTKTDTVREVPVHPTLAKMLATWRLGGWERYMGRVPRLEDILLPTYRGNHLRDPTVLANLHRDLAALGLRARRTHDTRRTMISIARDDLANKDILKWITHGRSGDIMDDYSSLAWSTLCAEIAKVRVVLRESRVVQLRQVSGASCDTSCDDEPVGVQMLSIANALQPENECPGRDSNPHSRGRGRAEKGRKALNHSGEPEPAPDPSPPTPPYPVTASQLDRRRIAVKLQAALTAWMEGESTTDLRARLNRLLSLFPEGR